MAEDRRRRVWMVVLIVALVAESLVVGGMYVHAHDVECKTVGPVPVPVWCEFSKSSVERNVTYAERTDRRCTVNGERVNCSEVRSLVEGAVP